jgi:hypothetical protein
VLPCSWSQGRATEAVEGQALESPSKTHRLSPILNGGKPAFRGLYAPTTGGFPGRGGEAFTNPECGMPVEGQCEDSHERVVGLTSKLDGKATGNHRPFYGRVNNRFASHSHWLVTIAVISFLGGRLHVRCPAPPG